MLDFAGKLCDVTGCHQHLVKPRFIASAAALLVAVGLDTVFYFFSSCVLQSCVSSFTAVC